MIDRETATLRDTVVAFPRHVFIYKSLSSRNGKQQKPAIDEGTNVRFRILNYLLLIESSIQYPSRVSFGGFALAIIRAISDSHDNFTRLSDAVDDR